MTSRERKGGASVEIREQRVSDGGAGVSIRVGGEPVRARSNLPDWNLVPFVGRVEDLETIGGALADPTKSEKLVLWGQPGIGKSRLAVQYAEENLARYPGGAFFLRFDTVNRASEPPPDLAVLLRLLGLPAYPEERLEDQCLRALASLGDEPVLLLYDDVKSEGVLEAWLPPPSLPCHVIATSTSGDWSPTRRALRVELLPDGDGIALVHRLIRDRDAASVNARALVERAAGVTVELCALAKAADSDVRHGDPVNVPPRLTGEAGASFERALATLSPDARALLSAACLFEPARVPLDGLRALLFEEGGWSEERFKAARNEALDRTLLQAGGDALRVHGLVARFVRGREESAVPISLWRKHADGFLAVAGRVEDNPADAAGVAGLAAYPSDVRFWIERDDGVAASLLDRAHRIGGALAEVGRFEEARPWSERAVEHAQKGDVHGRVDHESLGTSLHQVGYCYSRVGRFEEARSWFERAVEHKQKGDVHGRVDHESLGKSLHQVGYCYARVERFEEARSWFERAVEHAQKGDVHGRVDHESLGTSLHQVGYCYSRVGRFEEARSWFERAVEHAQKGDVHGRVDHQGLGKSLHHVGIYYSRVGRFEEARPWFERAVEHAQKGDVHGRVDHESLGKSLSQAGYCYSKVGRGGAPLVRARRRAQAERRCPRPR